MKEVYLVHIKLPEVFTADFYAMIPKQRQVTKSLLEEGVILSYSMDMDRKNVWAFFEARSITELMDVLSTFPLIRDVKVDIQELAFYNSAPINLPEVILN